MENLAISDGVLDRPRPDEAPPASPTNDEVETPPEPPGRNRPTRTFWTHSSVAFEALEDGDAMHFESPSFPRPEGSTSSIHVAADAQSFSGSVGWLARMASLSLSWSNTWTTDGESPRESEGDQTAEPLSSPSNIVARTMYSRLARGGPVSASNQPRNKTSSPSRGWWPFRSRQERQEERYDLAVSSVMSASTGSGAAVCQIGQAPDSSSRDTAGGQLSQPIYRDSEPSAPRLILPAFTSSSTLVNQVTSTREYIDSFMSMATDNTEEGTSAEIGTSRRACRSTDIRHPLASVDELIPSCHSDGAAGPKVVPTVASTSSPTTSRTSLPFDWDREESLRVPRYHPMASGRVMFVCPTSDTSVIADGCIEHTGTLLLEPSLIAEAESMDEETIYGDDKNTTTIFAR